MTRPDTIPISFTVQGVTIPALGISTFRGDTPSAKVKDVVYKGLVCGYRHIDTAAAYMTEQEVGEAIIMSEVPREEIFVTAKLPQTCHHPREVEAALDRTLKALKLDYVDLYLMHFPHAYVPGPKYLPLKYPGGKRKVDHSLSLQYPATWRAMEQLVEMGKTRLIGVGNFNVLKLRKLLETARIRPAVNQVELHPVLQTGENPCHGKPLLRDCLYERHMRPLTDTDIFQLSRKRYRSPAQLILSWIVQQNISVVPRTSRITHLLENMDLKRLTSEEMAAMSSLSMMVGETRFSDPRHELGFDIFDEGEDQPANEWYDEPLIKVDPELGTAF